MRASLLALAKSIYYIPNGYVLPERVWFLWCFSLKTGTDLSILVWKQCFEETTGVINIFVV